MNTTYVEYEFQLVNGMSKVIKVNDIMEDIEDIEDTELTSLADLLIEKNSKWNGSEFTKLKRCSKFSVEETKIV